ncbi:BlaI/MecI/CopY family transcriptional regulator [Clostridium omnivorum]|uniref:Beta-lactamase repressor n=1 Tax=Clostridium omnivorum TaxID=1604902 RepID=A0ABQ5N7U9_9CLOT|nr:BlaI/MecI/CopY family transcriptional regulator [Clostridium sp. E14]GLC31313.1 beta-lactamase repressor [Clostridium sp. E14]
MKEIPAISDAEWEVMKVVWGKYPITAGEIISVMENQKDWKPKTIKTLIGRLVKKDVLGYEEKQRVYCYYPLISQEDCIQKENKSFIKRVYNGAVKSMLVNFINDSELTEEDVRELQKLLQEREEN